MCLWTGGELVQDQPGSISPQLTGYQARRVVGWTVRIQDSLWDKQRKNVEKALPLLEQQLRQIVEKVPAPAVNRLRSVTLWFSTAYPGVGPTAEYHPGADWLREHGRNPAMVHGVEFTDISDFEAEMVRMPNFTLHELAHAYHDQVLGFDSAEVEAAWRRALASGKYDRVERHNGQGRPSTQERAYAMTNAQEYFAECSEAFFATNDFYPFNHDDLKRHDPEMEALLARVWGVTR